MGFYEGIRKNIRKALIDREMTQAELAKQSGMSPQHMNDMLTGRRKIKIYDLVKMADVLNVSLDSLCPSKEQAAG